MNMDTNSYQHGYQDAVSEQSYENVAESHGAEAYGPSGEGIHEGEDAGYEAGFRAWFWPPPPSPSSRVISEYLRR